MEMTFLDDSVGVEEAREKGERHAPYIRTS